MPDKWVTIAPIFNLLTPPAQIPYDLGRGASISGIPEYIKKMTPSNNLDLRVKEITAGASHCLLLEYEAEALDHSQREAEVKVILAYISFWLVKNTDFKFSGYAHLQLAGGSFLIRHTDFLDRCFIGISGTGASHNSEELSDCAKVFDTLQSLALDTTLFSALNALLKGIREHQWEWRYLCFWVALEGLFGADREITFRLSQRLGLFLGATPTEANEIFKFTKKAYEYRSKVVHGARLKNFGGKDSIDVMETLESLLRRAINKIIHDPSLIEVFQGKNRETYLDQLAFR